MNPISRAAHLLKTGFRDFDGPLTEQIVREPGGFGLGQVPSSTAPDRTTAMVCGFCSTGCSLNIHLRQGEATNLTPDAAYPVNLGMACPKGWEALAPLRTPSRATVPLFRETRGGEPVRIPWQTAAETFRDRFRAILDAHGPESVAFLGTGQICTEELAFLGAFAKFGMGLVHGDGNTRQCMATAVAAYKESFGFDAPPYTYADFEESDAIVLVGSNLCIAHPILWQRVLRNQRSPEIVVIDPRRTETAMQATRHLAIRPRSDLVFFYGLAHLLVARGWTDSAYLAEHTEGYEAFAEHVRAFDPATVSSATGIPSAELESLAALIGDGRRVSFWWTMGVNQGHEATRTAQAIINLALLTGNLGKPGTGANSITGQCNAMGSRLFSNTTNLLGGHDFESAADREKVAAALGIPVARIPDRRSLPYHRILEGVREGRIKGLWVIATNPAHSWIGREDFDGLLDRLDFLVVQDMYHDTETARRADLLLPAAAWGEKDGTFINSERRIGLVKSVARAPGEALSDFRILRLLAETWGCGELFREWRTPEAVFGLLQRLSAGQPCDFGGIDGYRELEERGGVQWPKPGPPGAPAATERRLFEDGRFFTPNGRARLVFDAIAADPEPPGGDYPLRLLTGRGSSAQWHTQTRTRHSAVLRRLGPQGNHVEIHPADARALGIGSGDAVAVTSRRGTIEVTAFVTANVAPGTVFIPMHEESTNRITLAVFDPHSHQPGYKSCAVRVEKAENAAR
ncbi:MAG TPA: molybdopterin oxidoreductase family protein [Bacteroidia bacterium]|nr:molybdopterin oxidoreductase family protein [Bacteroidia bacterium]